MGTVPTSTQALDSARRELVLLELSRIIESSVFRQSKRSCRFLSHIVNATLGDRLDSLRERSLGVELFDRPADYWTSEDAIVRVAAAEVRKRLAQFYDTHGNEHKLRIELPSGGYIPEFRFSDPDRPAPGPIPSAPAPAPPAIPTAIRPASRRWLLYAALGCLAVSGAVLAYWSFPSRTARFWSPILRSREPVIVSLGLVEGFAGGVKPSQLRERLGTECAESLERCRAFASKFEPIMLDSVPTGDVVGIARLMSFLGEHHKAFRVRGYRDVSYSDIKESDSILVAYFSNPWTVESHKSTRFRLATGGGKRYVIDTQRPDFRDWAMVGGWPLMNNEVDFALITRLEDPKTNKTRIIIGGFTPYGTEAALTLASSEKAMNAALASLPSGWESHNLQLVIRTTVTAMMPGPPEVLATHAW